MRERPLTYRVLLHYMMGRKKTRLRNRVGRHSHLGDLASGKCVQRSFPDPAGMRRLLGKLVVPDKRKGSAARIVGRCEQVFSKLCFSDCSVEEGNGRE